LRILLIEDNDINRLVLCRMLEADTHHVTQADNGLSGVHLAQTQPFDLILMDISMPGMDGVTATEHIRQGGAGALNRDTPILPVTAHALPEDLQRFREAGMGDSLIKPITRSTLRAALADISDPTLAQPSASRPSQGDTPPVLSAELIDTLNETLTPQHRRAAMRSFAHEIDRFLDGQSLFGDPASPPDLTLLAQEAHRLCGAAGLFGAPRLAALLGQLQEAAQKGEADALLSFLPKLRPCWAETRKALLQKGLLQDS
jgi:CheY-like chemotaxis protein